MAVSEKVAKSRWLVSFKHADNYEWVSSIAAEAHIKGSDVIEALIEEKRTSNDKSFKNSLANMQLKIELQKINDQRAELEEKAKDLRRKFGEKVPA